MLAEFTKYLWFLRREGYRDTIFTLKRRQTLGNMLENNDDS